MKKGKRRKASISPSDLEKLLSEEDKKLFLNAVANAVPVRSTTPLSPVIPAKTGIQRIATDLDSRFRGNDKEIYRNDTDWTQQIFNAENIRDFHEKMRHESSQKSSQIKKPYFKCDLHGLRESVALEVLEEFLVKANYLKSTQVLVIHGKGSGILMNSVHLYLKQHPLVRSFTQAPKRLGAEGAVLVTLKKP